MKRRRIVPKHPEMKVEARQTKLFLNAEAIDRWQRKLLRAARELEKLLAQRRRLLNPPKGKLVYKGEQLTGMGGGAVELNDGLEGI
jgi:transposase